MCCHPIKPTTLWLLLRGETQNSRQWFSYPVALKYQDNERAADYCCFNTTQIPGSVFGEFSGEKGTALEI